MIIMMKKRSKIARRFGMWMDFRFFFHVGDLLSFFPPFIKRKDKSTQHIFLLINKVGTTQHFFSSLKKRSAQTTRVHRQ